MKIKLRYVSILSMLFVMMCAYHQASAAVENKNQPFQHKIVSVCYTPWWMNWRMPTQCLADIPLEAVNPLTDEIRKSQGYGKFCAMYYEQSVRNLERAGIDVVCWDTLCLEQASQLPPFLDACQRMNTRLKVTPYWDIAGAPSVQAVLDRFVPSIEAYSKMPLFKVYDDNSRHYTWGTRDMSADNWQKIIEGMKTSGFDTSGVWIAHLGAYETDFPEDTINRNASYFGDNLFQAAYRWQPAPIDLLERMDDNFAKSVPGTASYIASVYPMYRRAGYGINYTDPHGFQLLRKSWETSIRRSPAEVHVVTWNDYEEDTMFEPTLSRGYCMVDLNAYYSKLYKTGKAGVDATRIFVSYPRGRTDGDHAYIDVTGLFKRSDLPARISVKLVNDGGKIVKSFPAQRINTPGIQSALFQLAADQRLGTAVRPVISIKGAKGFAKTLGSELPWMDIYDTGANRDRHIWMAESVVSPVGISMRLDNSNEDFQGKFLKKRAKFMVTVKGNRPIHYILLKRNGEQAAIIKDGKAYYPTSAWNDGMGWQEYSDVSVRTLSDNTRVLSLPEPDSIYNLPPGGSGNVKINRELTGYSNDWYSAVAVTKDKYERAFSTPLVVKRKESDPAVVRYSTLSPAEGGFLDDTLKGFDLKNFGGQIPQVMEINNAKWLSITSTCKLVVPNEALSMPAFEVQFNLIQRQKSPAVILREGTGELDLYIDAKNHLVVRRLTDKIDPRKPGYARVSSKSVLEVDKPVCCRIVVSPGSGLSMYVNGDLQGRARIGTYPVNSSSPLQFGRPMDDDLLVYEHDQSKPADFHFYIGDFSIKGLKP